MEELLDESYLQGGEVGVLLLHGFSSTPSVFAELKKRLQHEGYSYSAPVVSGHGTHHDDLARTGPDDWIASAELAFHNLRQHCKRVVVIGVSMGGSLACILAARQSVDGLILVGTPRWIHRHAVIGFFSRLLPLVGIRYYHKPFRKQLQRGTLIGGPTFSYATLRFKSVRDLFRLVCYETPRYVKAITAPTLIIHSDSDGLVHPKSGDYFFQNIPSEDKQLVWLSLPHHTLHADEHVYTYIFDFLRQQAAMKK